MFHGRAGHGTQTCGLSSAQQPQLCLPHAIAQSRSRLGVLSGRPGLGCGRNSNGSLWMLLPDSTCTQAHRTTAITLQQRPQSSQNHDSHAHSSSSHHPPHRTQLRDDGSLKIIMLLSLSLTLLLLPWVCNHPTFLIAPALLAVTPVVGNGVRPVLKEVAAGLISTLRLMGMAAYFDITHELPPSSQQGHHSHSQHNNHHHGSSSSSSNGHSHNGLQHGQQQQQQGQYGRGPGGMRDAAEAAAAYHQQQQQQYRMQQQQPPRPSGPHSPWPNPAYMPPNFPIEWPLDPVPKSAEAAAGNPLAPPAAAAAGSEFSQRPGGMTNGGRISHPMSHSLSSADADGDWAPSSPPDPHRADPVSLQHLQQVLQADLAAEAELGQQQQQQVAAATAAATGAVASSSDSSRVRGVGLQQQQRSPRGSPRGSPAASLASVSLASVDALDVAAAAVDAVTQLEQQRQQQQQQPSLHAPLPQQQQQQQQKPPRDPRVLSKEAKQQLYGHHHTP